jgi:WD40 repeat protein
VTCVQLDGRPTAVTSARDHTVRLWDLRTRLSIGRIDLPSEVKAVAGTPAGGIVAAFGGDIILLERTVD